MTDTQLLQLMTVEEPLALRCGRTLPHYAVNYETYGTLSPSADNAILVCHSLTSNAHAGGPGGWWEAAIGPGRMLDTDKYFIVSSDTLAAGRSTSPASPDPATGRPYALTFPVLTVADLVAAQRGLLRHLGIPRWHAVIGGCFGGQQALEWAIGYPDEVRNAVVITATAATSAHTVAIFSVMRHLIRADPAWNGGDYYGAAFPTEGLNSAVAAAVPLWMSREAMEARFGRRTASGTGPGYTLGADFAVEEFIERIATTARDELDPNGLMYLMRAEEYFDLEHDYGGLSRAFDRMAARGMFVSYRRDWRYPPDEIDLLYAALRRTGGDSRHVCLDSPLGHGAFIRDIDGLAPEVARFLAEDEKSW